MGEQHQKATLPDSSSSLRTKTENVTKRFMWIGFFVGSAAGNMLPVLWGGDAISVSGFLLSMIGGIAGICLAYRWVR